MKKNLLRGLFTACLLIGCTLSASATLFLSENFDYTVGNLYKQGGWVRFSSHSANPIQVMDTKLAYEGYPGGVSGKSVQMYAPNISEDLAIGLDNATLPILSGDMYASFLVNITTAPTGKVYSANFLRSTSTIGSIADGKSPTEVGKVFFDKGTTDATVKIGVERGGTSAVFASTELTLGQTYLIVMKYSIAEGNNVGLDGVRLFINPASYTTEPATADATFAASGSGSGVTATLGLIGFELRQGGSYSAEAPIMNIGALRIADSYADLFPAAGGGEEGGGEEGGDTPDTTPTPTITLSAETSTIGTNVIFTTDVFTEEFTITAKDLTADITLTSNDSEVTVSPATIKKEDAMAEGGAKITVTLTSTTAHLEELPHTATISITSEGAEAKSISVPWYAYPSVTDIAGLRAAYKAEPEHYEYYGTKISQAVTITHIYTQSGYTMWCAQDATGGLFISNEYGVMSGTYQVGDQVAGLKGYLAGNTFTLGLPPAAAIANAPVEPTLITLEQWDADKAKYVGQLIRVNGVKLSLKEGEVAFEQPHQYTFLQGEKQGSTSLFAGSDLIGKALPTTTIDIIGIARNTNSLLISPRSSDDVIAIQGPATGLEAVTTSKVWAADGALYIQGAEDMQVEVLNVAGQTILTKAFAAGTHTVAIDGGMYLVKVNGTVEKLIVR